MHNNSDNNRDNEKESGSQGDQHGDFENNDDRNNERRSEDNDQKMENPDAAIDYELRRNPNRLFNLTIFNKIVPQFKGDQPSLKIFLRRCEAYLSTLDDDQEEIMMTSLVYKLSGKAFRAYEEKAFTEWMEFRKTLIEIVDGGKSLTTLLNELTSVKQTRGQAVQDFANIVQDKLSDILEKIISEHQSMDARFSFRSEYSKVAIRAFKEGLLPSIKARVVTASAKTLDEIIKIAVEEAQFTPRDENFRANRFDTSTHPISNPQNNNIDNTISTGHRLFAFRSNWNRNNDKQDFYNNNQFRNNNAFRNYNMFRDNMQPRSNNQFRNDNQTNPVYIGPSNLYSNNSSGSRNIQRNPWNNSNRYPTNSWQRYPSNWIRPNDPNPYVNMNNNYQSNFSRSMNPSTQSASRPIPNQFYRNTNQPHQANSAGPIQRPQRNVSWEDRQNLKCTFCQKSGHKTETCYARLRNQASKDNNQPENVQISLLQLPKNDFFEVGTGKPILSTNAKLN